ncbi:thiamine phosphate synthase [Xanthobacter oligotrophicus]|uniref:thiamine phosphate synthase n=1 Tax=Xanthobacter oligotrophicus TaxID=2607286 RepID=UPI00165D33B3|nr:thiamine phosphate synthase [Xanthobacter oligotrophicus]MCG5236063.1 thiamine phosphate synthase [Xanthobacter oligotrophicus]
MLVFTLTPELRPDVAAAAVRAGDVAAVVLRVPEGGAPDSGHLRAVAEAIQKHDAAVLVDGPENLVAAAGLDGVHVSDLRSLQAALRALKPQAIVGAGGLASRHDAMEAGEGGADYVFFGALEPQPGDTAEILDLVGWWAELFEVPCVGLAASLDEAEALARAGADFVALAETLVADGGAATVRAAMDRLARVDAQP